MTVPGLPPGVARLVAAYPPPVLPRGRPLVACDLDRTLIYSAAALGRTGPEPLVVVEMRDGRPLSYCTRRAGQLLAALTRLAPLVPVTTRTVAQFRRVRLPGGPAPHAVVANGGQILVGGRADPEWARSVAGLLGRDCAPLAEVRDHLRGVGDPAWLLRQHTADDLFCYAVVDRAALPPALVSDLAGWCASRGWVVSVQGRKLYCVPRPLTKQAAVAEVARRLGCDVTLAAGDSLLDRDLLAAADAGVRPAHGELHDIGWHRDQITATASAGVLAGEEIAARLLGAVLAASGPR